MVRILFFYNFLVLGVDIRESKSIWVFCEFCLYFIEDSCLNFGEIKFFIVIYRREKCIVLVK